MKRNISAIELPNVVPGSPPTGDPILDWVNPAELLVDEAYQRDLSDKSRKLIQRIVEGWDWRRFKPPIVAMTDEGFEVLDGQHSATAAVCHPGIDKIPVVIVDAAEQQDRASAFIGHNRDRIAVTAAQLQAAAVTAGDKDALAVESACRLAEVTLLRVPPSNQFKPAETIAAGAIGQLVKQHGIQKGAEILTVLRVAGFAPIQAAQIKAVTAILTDQDNPVRPEDLTRAVMAMGAGPAESEAKVFAATHKVPLWRGLVKVWLQATKAGRRKRAEPMQENPANLRTSDVGTPKRDQREPRGGWASGPLIKRCLGCDETFIGGYKATECADCAYGQQVAA